MKKIMNWVLAATRPLVLTMVLCGATAFIACTNEDNPVTPTDDNLADKIIGSWIHTATDGALTPTNRKSIHTFVKTDSGLKMYNTIAVTGDNDPWWVYQQEMDVTIEGNHITMKTTYDDGKKVVTELDVTTISASGMEYQTVTHIIQPDGQQIDIDSRREVFTRVTRDYSNDVLGTWEGSIQQGQSVYDDNLTHRWEFKADGTYVYYCCDEGQWQVSADTKNEYFVDGTLICTRWTDPVNYPGQELREWWEITSIENGVMTWKALREKEDGTTYVVTFTMQRVEED